MSTLNKRSRNQKGVAAVELAIILPMFGILLLGVLEIGGMARDHQALQNGAREGARFSALLNNKIVGGTPGAETRIKDSIIAYLQKERITIVAGDITIDQAYALSLGTGWATASKITITYNRPVLFPGISRYLSVSAPLTASAVFRNFY